MPRPPKPEAAKRLQRFNLRLTLAELEKLREQAEACGLEPHAYARRRVLGHQVAPASRAAMTPTTAALINEVNRLGVNVNQLARAVHSDRTPPMDWRELAAECERVLAKVSAGYGP